MDERHKQILQHVRRICLAAAGEMLERHTRTHHSDADRQAMARDLHDRLTAALGRDADLGDLLDASELKDAHGRLNVPAILAALEELPPRFAHQPGRQALAGHLASNARHTFEQLKLLRRHKR